ncbi:calphotin-like [Helicoverpa zea]|uniref:calphotin-like n=1 Tax=Helicoverpa zea TaxID=7113 RepID=UPI001F572AAA|nr:calphotin-like [Helicoverpa zea]
MKFFAIFVALVAAVSADFSSWSLHELSEAIQNPNTDPAILPALTQALNDLMDAIVAEKPVAPVVVETPTVVDLTGWTLNDLSEALQNPNTDPALIPHLEHALNQMMDAIFGGVDMEAVGVPAPAMEISHWTLQQLDSALSDPATDPALIPYLEHALNQMMDALFSGQQMEVISVVAPVGLAPAPALETPVIPTPVIVAPPPTPVETPVTTPVQTPASPLVQIIVNIKQQEAPVVSPAPVVGPTPVGLPAPAMVSTEWTLNQLDAALSDPSTHPAMIPYLENALNEMMWDLFNGQHMESITVVVPAVLVNAIEPRS